MIYSKKLQHGMLVEIVAYDYDGFEYLANWATVELNPGQWMYVSDTTICMWYQDIPQSLLDECISGSPFDAVYYGNNGPVAYGTQIIKEEK